MAVHTATQYESDPTPPLWTIDDVARRLAISRDSVYRLVRSGALSPLRVGERLRFRPEEIEQYLERRREKAP
jgi:excisionase family DNA binding protein